MRRRDPEFVEERATTPSRRAADNVPSIVRAHRVLGVRIEEIEDPLMKEVRYMDKLVDELAKGRPRVKILRT